MRSKKIRKNLFIAEGVLIAVLLIVLLVLIGQSGRKNSTASEEGRAYIAAENAKDPAEALAAIRAARDAAAAVEPEAGTGADPAAEVSEDIAVETGEEPAADVSETAAPDPSQEIIQDLHAQIESLDIRPLSPEENVLLQNRFDSTVIVGDSMAQAVFEYGFLDENHVRYKRSAVLVELEDCTQGALEMLPDRIIFFTGLRNVDYYETPADYYNAFLERIHQIQAADPAIQIYICSLLPPSDDLSVEREDLASRSPAYDEQLRQLCNDTSAQYIDISWMVRQDLYLEDGIHFDEWFYTIWIQYAALAAGL